MTRNQRVKAAIAHQTPDRIPSCIHLAGDGKAAYADRLFEKYTDDRLQSLVAEGKLSREHAMYYGMGNHVLTVSCPWWNWYDVPAAYSAEEAPDFLPKTIGYGSYEGFAQTVRNIKEHTDAYVLVTIWGSHFEKANFARGIENFLADIAGEPEFAQRLLYFIIHKNMVQSGVLYGYIGSVEKIVGAMKEEMGCPDAKVIATGGMAHIVRNNSSVIDEINPDLTLTGLRIIYEKNQA